MNESGIPRERIAAEISSYDTIGSAFFARAPHTEARGLLRWLAVNSDFHTPRTEAIFRCVFGVAPDRGRELTFERAGE